MTNEDCPIKIDVKLHGPYFTRSFIRRCENEMLVKVAMTGHQISDISPLELLGMIVLRSTADYYGVGLGQVADVVGTRKD